MANGSNIKGDGWKSICKIDIAYVCMAFCSSLRVLPTELMNSWNTLGRGAAQAFFWYTPYSPKDYLRATSTCRKRGGETEITIRPSVLGSELGHHTGQCIADLDRRCTSCAGNFECSIIIYKRYSKDTLVVFESWTFCLSVVKKEPWAFLSTVDEERSRANVQCQYSLVLDCSWSILWTFRAKFYHPNCIKRRERPEMRAIRDRYQCQEPIVQGPLDIGQRPASALKIY